LNQTIAEVAKTPKVSLYEARDRKDTNGTK